MAVRAGVQGKWRVTANGYRVSFGDDENILELDNGNGCMLSVICFKKYPTESYTLKW